MDKNKRITWVDSAKFICISFVLFSHMEYVPTVLQCVFKPFFLTGFFFLTGYVFNEKKSFKDFFIGRVKTIFLPAVIFSVVYLLDFKAIINGTYTVEAILQDLSVLMRQQRGQGDVLWFLYVSFLAEIPLLFFLKQIELKKTIIISFTLCELTILYVKYLMMDVPYWYLHLIFVAMFFMVLGKWYRQNENRVNVFGKNKVIFLATGLYLISVWVVYYCFGYFININEYNINSVMWYIITVVGVLLCITYAKKMPYNDFLSFCGRNTIIFYLLHDRVRGVINVFIKKLGLWDLIDRHTIIRLFACIIVYLIEVIVLFFAAKFILRFIPFIIGRKYEKKNSN